MIQPVRRPLHRRVGVAAGLLVTALLAACADDTVQPAAIATVPAGDDVTVSSTSVPDESSPNDAASATNSQPALEDEALDLDSSETTTAATAGDPTVDAANEPIVSSAPIVPLLPGPTVAAAIEDEAELGNGVTVNIVDVEAVEVTGHSAGERSGPGVIVTVEIENGTTEAIDLAYVIVDLIRSDGSSAIPVELVVPSVLAGELEPGESASGRYQYFIPVDQRSPATLTVSYAIDVPTALFTGDLPDD